MAGHPPSLSLHRRVLDAAIAVAVAEIEAAAARDAEDDTVKTAASTALETARVHENAALAESTEENPAALESLAASLGLSPFERRLAAAAAGVVLDPAFAALVAHHSQHHAFTFAFALETFAEAHWTAVTPRAPLRRWQVLLPLPPAQPFTSPLALDERILHFLLGIDATDARVEALARPVHPGFPLTRAQQTLATELVTSWDDATDALACPTLWLQGASRSERRAVAVAAANILGWEIWVCDAPSSSFLPVPPDAWRILWEREALLRSAVLLLEAEPHELPIPEAVRLAETIRGPVILSGGRWPEPARPRRQFTIPAPEPEDRIALWKKILTSETESLNAAISRSAVQFRLPLDGALTAAHEANVVQIDDRGTALWSACKRLARRAIDDVAERILPRGSDTPLILPPGPRALLRDLLLAARHQHRVSGEGGFARQSTRGLGLTALFAGPSGTGKTMAAEVVATELGLDLYRIDLSAIVSKYIGETEKNLRRVFDAADDSGAILLFDEADALFGKRGEVKDSHDRYANIEIGYLLQRMETYRGLALLTTNHRPSLDEAFTRRLRFIIQFPFPDAAARAEIWLHALPPETTREELDWNRLARLDVAGGNIRNIALSAAILAAAETRPVAMRDLAQAARAECAKLERPVAASELSGWS